jgi:hypothetical protein
MPIQIFTEEDRLNIERTLKQIEDLKVEIDKAKRAGIEIGEIEKQLLDAEKKLKAIYSVYFKGK